MYITLVDKTKLEVISGETSGSSVDKQLVFSAELKDKNITVQELLNSRLTSDNIKKIVVQNDDGTIEEYTAKDVFVHKQRRGNDITLSCRFNVEN